MQENENDYDRQYRNILNMKMDLESKTDNVTKREFNPGYAPVQIKDNRTLTEKLRDINQLKTDIRTTLLNTNLTDGPNIDGLFNGFVDLDGLDNAEITFFAQHIMEIVDKLKKQYRYGVPARALINYIREYRRKYRELHGVDFGGDTGKLDRIINNLGAPGAGGVIDLAVIRADLERVNEANRQLAVNMLNESNEQNARRIQQQLEDMNALKTQLDLTMRDYQHMVRLLEAKADEIKTTSVSKEEMDVLAKVTGDVQIENAKLMTNLKELIEANNKANLVEINQTMFNMLKELKTVTEESAKIAALNMQMQEAVPMAEAVALGEAQSVKLVIEDIIHEYPIILGTNKKRDQNKYLEKVKQAISDVEKVLGGRFERMDRKIQKIDKYEQSELVSRSTFENLNLNGTFDMLNKKLDERIDTLSSIVSSQGGQPEETKVEESPYLNIRPEQITFGSKRGTGFATLKSLENKPFQPKRIRYERVFEDQIDKSRGISNAEKYVKLGKYYVDRKRLIGTGVMSLKRKSGNNVMNVEKITDKLVTIIDDMIHDKAPGINEYNDLSEDEKVYLYEIIKKADILDRFKIPTPNKSDEAKRYNEFEILKGEILAGNNDETVIKKFKALMLDMSNKKLLARSEVNNILLDLLKLGY